VRRIVIVAVTRKLAIALWRYLETGLLPDGADLKAR
jgi:transposase